MKKLFLLFFVWLIANGIFNGLTAQVSNCNYNMWGQNPTATGCEDGAIWCELPLNLDPTLRHDVFYNGILYNTVFDLGSRAGITWASYLVKGSGTYEYYAYRTGESLPCNYHKIVITKPTCNLGVTNLNAHNSNTSCSGGSITGKIKGGYCGTLDMSLVDSSGNRYTTLTISNDSSFIFSQLPTNTYKLTIKNNNDSTCFKIYSANVISCDVITTGFLTTDITRNGATLKWNVTPCSQAYSVQYKLYGTLNWKSKTTMTNSVTITNLMPGKRYQWKVRSIGSTSPLYYSAFSNLNSFYTISPGIIERQIETEDYKISSIPEFTLYPNPATQKITLTFPQNAGDVQLQVINQTGQVVIEQQLSSLDEDYQRELDIQALSSGIYILSIRKDGTVQTKQFLKQ